MGVAVTRRLAEPAERVGGLALGEREELVVESQRELRLDVVEELLRVRVVALVRELGEDAQVRVVLALRLRALATHLLLLQRRTPLLGCLGPGHCLCQVFLVALLVQLFLGFDH